MTGTTVTEPDSERPLRVITWNVNSIRTRLERVLALLERHEPDVLCLQETKTPDSEFPKLAFSQLGYRCTLHGQPGFNGVALISRVDAMDVERGFDGNPVPDQARAISASYPFGSRRLRILNLYVINGQHVGSDKYTLKLAWLDTLARWMARTYRTDDALLVCGDFNIVPSDVDVYNPKAWKDKVLCTAAERQRLQAMIDWGLVDLMRSHHGPDEQMFSWWDYRYGAFKRNWGLRIDLMLGTDVLSRRTRGVFVDAEERADDAGPGKPSDHAPVILDLV